MHIIKMRQYDHLASTDSHLYNNLSNRVRKHNNLHNKRNKDEAI